MLALIEATTCYEISMDLETLGQWTVGTEQPIRMGAHNRRHPHTGDLHAVQYTVRDPILHGHRPPLRPAGRQAERDALCLCADTDVNALAPTAAFGHLHALLKFDTETGRSTHHDIGNMIVGDAAFVPRPGGTWADDGYLAAFACDPVQRSSRLALLDARRINGRAGRGRCVAAACLQGPHDN